MIDGNTEITRSAPHMGFSMEMNYINQDLWKKYREQSSNEEEQKQEKEAAQL